MKSIAQILEEVAKDFNATIIYPSKEVKEKATGHIHCPVNGWDCPYFDANGCCMMYPEFDPIEECDDFYSIWGDDEEADYICFENHTKGE